jgi:hypothetical protein
MTNKGATAATRTPTKVTAFGYKDFSLTLVALAGALDAHEDAHADENDGSGPDVGLRDVHEVGQVTEADDHDGESDCVNSKGHLVLPSAKAPYLP